MNVITKKVSLPDGREISIETGKLAKQADGAVMLRMGDTMLLATVCAAKDAVPGTDFMPLQVEYSANGRFPGGFTKREGKASDEEILTCRLVDRALRPLFPSNYHAEVYVNVIVFSADGKDMPDALAGFAASAALACSDIPFEGPISEVRVARINGEFVINPTFEQLKEADMDLMVGATEENIMMVEGEMKEVQEKDLLEALKAAHDAIKPQCRLQKELMKELGKDVKREYCHEVNDDDLKADIQAKCYQPAYDVTKQGLEKQERAEAFEKIREDYKEAYAAAHTDLSEEEFMAMTDSVVSYLRQNNIDVETRDKPNPKLTAFRRNLYFPEMLFNLGLTGHREERLLVKIEAQDQGIAYQSFVANINRMGFFFNIQVPPLDVLCAMKFAAILARQKGRDFYDTIFLLSKTKPNLEFLKARTGISSIEELKNAVSERLKGIDLSQKQRDFSHLVFNEQNAKRILQFADVVDSQL